jgi:hypothetical protein
MWNGQIRVPDEADATSPPTINVMLGGTDDDDDGRVSMQLALRPFGRTSSWGGLLRAFENWVLADEAQVRREFCEQLMRTVPRGVNEAVAEPSPTFLAFLDASRQAVGELREMRGALPRGSRGWADELYDYWDRTVRGALEMPFENVATPVRASLAALLQMIYDEAAGGPDGSFGGSPGGFPGGGSDPGGYGRGYPAGPGPAGTRPGGTRPGGRAPGGAGSWDSWDHWNGPPQPGFTAAPGPPRAQAPRDGSSGAADEPDHAGNRTDPPTPGYRGRAAGPPGPDREEYAGYEPSGDGIGGPDPAYPAYDAAEGDLGFDEYRAGGPSSEPGGGRRSRRRAWRAHRSPDDGQRTADGEWPDGTVDAAEEGHP